MSAWGGLSAKVGRPLQHVHTQDTARVEVLVRSISLANSVIDV